MSVARGADATRQEERALLRWQRDPVAFDREVLGDSPTERQAEILKAVRDNRRVAVRSAHAVGKSFIAARVALWFLYCFMQSIVVTTAPTDRQVKNILWREIRRAHARALLPLGGVPLKKELTLDEDWYALGFSTDEADSVSGLHSNSGYAMVVIDEASGVSPEIYEAVEGLLTSPHSRLLLIGQPHTPSGPFYEEFRQPGASKHRISAFDSPNVQAGKIVVPGLVDQTWIDEREKRWGKSSPMYRVRVLGEFPEMREDALIPLGWIEKAIERGKVADPTAGDPSIEVHLGVDVARQGSNETVTAWRRGRRLRVYSRRSKDDTMATAGRTVEAAKLLRAHVVKVDVVGVGGGVVDRLLETDNKRQLRGVEVIGINVGESPFDGERFKIRRDEIYWHLREAFETGVVDLEGRPEDLEDLTAQLSSIGYGFSSNGKIRVESKDDLRKRKLPSPDLADAIALAHAEAAGGAVDVGTAGGWGT